MDWQENMNLFSANIVDNYNSWAKPWIDNIDEISKKNIIDLLKDQASIDKANDSFKNIMNLYNDIDEEYKNYKIKSREISNIFIIIFSVFLIGLFFLPFFKKNKKTIKEFQEYKIKQLELIAQQNEIKKSAFVELFSQIKKNDLLNSYLKGTGLYAIRNVFGSQLEKYFQNLNKDYIGLKTFGVFKAGKQNIYVCNTCNEYWDNVVTSASLTVPYTTTTRDSNGNWHTETRTEVVTAYHYELTPFREIRSFTIIGFKKGVCNIDVDWVLSPNKLENTKNKKNEFEKIKFKKIATNKKEQINNSTIFENFEFNNDFHVEIFEANGSIEQEQDVATWFTIGTQEKFVQMHSDLTQKNKFNLIDFLLYKIDDALIVKNKYLIDCSWYMNRNVLDEIDVNPKISLEDNIINIANIGKQIAISNMLATCEFLNFTKVNSLLLLDPICNDYSLIDDSEQLDEEKILDSESIINYGNLVNAFESYGQKALLDNIKTIFLYQNKNLTLGVYEIDNYYTENYFDSVSVYAACASEYVTVEVPYTKYYKYVTQSVGIGIKKQENLNIDSFIQKICNEFGQSTFNIFNDDDYIYLFANNTHFNIGNIDDLKIRLLNLFI